MNKIFLFLFLLIPFLTSAQESLDNYNITNTPWINVGSPGFSAGKVESTTIGINALGEIYTAFIDYANGQKVTVMKFDGSKWNVLGLAGFTPGSSVNISLAFGLSNEPYVTFDCYAHLHQVMKFDGTNWVNFGTPIPCQCSTQDPCIAIDSSGIPYVAFFDPSFFNRIIVVKYNQTSNSWNYVGIPGFSPGWVDWISLKISPNGIPYVSYSDYYYSQKISVRKFNGTGWDYVGSPGFSNGAAYETTIAFTSTGQPYVSFEDASLTGITVMKFDGTNWVYVGPPGFPPGLAQYPSLAISLIDQPYVAFSDFGQTGQRKVSVMKFDGNNWVIDGTPRFSAGRADYVSLTFNPINNQPYVAYEDYGYSLKATVMHDTTCYVGSAGPITGHSQVCTGDSEYNYFVAPISYANSYSWILPFGATITSGSGTNNITIIFGTNAVSGVISVHGVGLCNGLSSQIQVNVYPIPVPTINGSSDLCVNSGYFNYTTETGMSSYQWTISPGGTITFGQGSNVIQVVWNQAGNQWVAVNYANSAGCMALVPSMFPVSVKQVPGPAGAVTGSPVVCAGSDEIRYSIAPVANAVTYVWELPAGASIASGSGTNVITVNFATYATSGDITVYGNNLCGNGIPSPNFYVTVNPIPVTPTISENGDTLTSSAPIGNQWYYNGMLLANDTNQTYVVSPYLPGYYWTQVTLNGCISDMSNHIYCSHVGLTEKNQESISVYPVPNDGHFNIDIHSQFESIYRLIIYDNLGIRIYENELLPIISNRVFTIDLNNIPNGIYTAVFLSSGNQIIKKIPVNK